MRRKTIYLLDSDDDPAIAFKSRHEKHSPWEKVEVFKSSGELIDKIKTSDGMLPDIILVDLYSTKPSGTITREELDNLETELSSFAQKRRELASRSSDAWSKSGTSRVKDIIHDLEELSLDGVIPIAISSRYGRRLLDGTEIRDLSRENIYWVWKNQDIVKSLAQDEKLRSLGKEEIQKLEMESSNVESECIDEVIRFHQKDRRIYDENKALSQRVKALENELAQRELEYEFSSTQNRTIRLSITTLLLAFFMFVALLPHIRDLESMARDAGFSGDWDINTLIGAIGILITSLSGVLSFLMERVLFKRRHNKAFKSDSQRAAF